MAEVQNTPAGAEPDISNSATTNSSDLWTPAQESSLLKAIMQYKPVGLHARFRMLAIRTYLLQSGTIDPDAEHTRIPGIWAKLATLYDLEALGAREDSVFERADSESGNEDEMDSNEDARDDQWRDFQESLFRYDAQCGTGAGTGTGIQRRIRDMMEERKFDGDQSSPPQGDTNDMATDEPRSSPVPASVRGTRSSRKGRVNKLKVENVDVGSPSASTRGSRRTSKAASEVNETGDEDTEMHDGDDEPEDEEEEDDEDDDDDGDDGENEEEEDKTRGATARGRTTRRGRTRRGRKRG